MKRLDFYWCRQTGRSGFKVHSLPRLRPELICHERPAACKNVAIDSTKSTAHIDRIKVSVTGTMKRGRMSRSPRAWMSQFAPPTFLSRVTTHLLPVSRLSTRPVSIQALCEWRSRPSPGHYKLLTKRNFCCRGGCMWHHVIPRGCVGSGAGSSLLCGQSRSTPVHASWIILPCHLYCAQVWARHTGILTVWGSVGETLGAPNPEEFKRTN